MDALSDSTVVTASETALATTLDGEAVVLESESGTYYGLNEVATFVWNQVQEPRTVTELRESVLGEYDVQPERCKRDLDSVLTRMEDNGLVEIKDAT